MKPTKTPRHSVSVAGVILNEDDSQVVLIRRRDNGRWEPPGGVLELRESVVDGLKREIREETGLEVAVVGLTGIYKNMSRGIVALVYRCRAENEPLSCTEEAETVTWTPVEGVDTLMLPAYAVRIHDAVSGGPVVTRTHDGVTVIGEA